MTLCKNKRSNIYRLLSTGATLAANKKTLHYKTIFQSTGVSIVKINSSFSLTERHQFDQTCPPSAPRCCRTLKLRLANNHICSFQDFSRCCCCCCVSWSACDHAAQLVARTNPHRYLVLLQRAHDYPTPVPTTVTSSKKHARLTCRATLP